MEYIVIDSDEVCDEVEEYIKSKEPHIEEIGEDYFLTEFERFEVTPDFKFVIDGITDYVMNGWKKDESEPKPEVKLPEISVDVNRVLFGKDSRTKIVNIAVKDDILHIYYLDGEYETIPCTYWVLAEKNLDGKMEKLEGDCSFRYIKKFTKEEQLKLFKKKFYSSIYCITDLIEQQLTYYGITVYKDITFDDVKVLSFDIETNGTQINKKSKVFTISNTVAQRDQKEIVQFVVNDYPSEKDMIEDWCAFVREINPSIITGHNEIGFDLPFMKQCANNHGIELNIGRDGSEMTIASRARNYRVDGSQTWEFKDINIMGRDVIDGMFLSVKYDFLRQFPSWGLKPIIEHLGLVAEGRQFYDASKIGENWHDPIERAKIIEYCRNDGDDSLAIFKLMGASYFYMARSIPRSFQSIINSATGGWLNSIMVRAYIQDNHSVAKTDESQKVTGGISFGVPGIHKNCLKIDVASLYPSIMRQWHVNNPSKDPKDVFFTMVDYNTKERLKNKKLAKETKEKHYNDLQESQKIFINSCYGLLGTNRVNYNNFSDADFITSIGRRILSLTMYWATGEDVNYWFQPEFTKGDEGYLNKEHDEQFEEYLTLASCTPRDFLIVNADTDSITFKKRDETEFSDKEREDLIKEINSLLPEMISYEDDGYFEKMVVTKAKNYVLYDGEKIKYKGSSFKDAKKEPKLKQLMKDVIEQGLIYEEKDWTDIYKGYVNEVSNIKDIKPWATKKSVTETLQDSDRLTETKVMDAIEGYDLKVGDKVFIYNAIDGIVQDSVKGELVWSKLKKKEYEDLGLVKNPPLESCTHTVKSYCYYCNPHLCSPKMIPNRVLRHVDEFDGNYDVDHYLNRCYDTISILSNVIDIERIKN